MKVIKQLRDVFARARKSAGQAGTAPAGKVSEVIESALRSAGLMQPSTTDGSDASADVWPKVSRVEPHTSPLDSLLHPASATPSASDRPSGRFLHAQFSGPQGSRAYRLYVPSQSAQRHAEMAPLIVMLHGCQQNAEDFAAGTRMNQLAELHGFLVAYPEQATNANGSRCWNWFRGGDQQRDRGEPAVIAGIVSEVIRNYRVDPKRVYIAGLSAGAAMAIVLGETYPEIFAAVGAHSGLAYASAHDVPSALAAMNGSDTALHSSPRNADQNKPSAGRRVPTIVFHGDADHTVIVRNSDRIVKQALHRAGTQTVKPTTSERGRSNGREYQREVYADASNRPIVECWIVTGAGHAWSGGNASGSYTDPMGPDASTEMLRFFMAATA